MNLQVTFVLSNSHMAMAEETDIVLGSGATW